MNLQEGERVTFIYNGSQEEFAGLRQEGIVRMVPQIDWQGGSVPADESGYATEIVVAHD